MPLLQTACAWLLDVVVPARCLGCGRHGLALCEACRRPMAARAHLCRPGTTDVPAVIALGPYEGDLRQYILALKFRSRRRAGTSLGELLGGKLGAAFDLVVPVPMDRSKALQRGYNQAEEIARGIAAVSHRPLCATVLRRRSRSARQSSLKLLGRRSNAERAFAPGSDIARVASRRVLLVDDVVTTGETMRACARILRSAAARWVTGAALAIKL